MCFEEQCWLIRFLSLTRNILYNCFIIKSIHIDMSLSNNQIAELKHEFEKDIKDLDLQIQFLETAYLQQTKESGNIIRGFQNYLAAKFARGAVPYRRVKIQPHQRLFSLSSTQSRANQMIDYSLTENKGQAMNTSNFNDFRNGERQKRVKNINYVKLQKGDKESSQRNPDNDSEKSSESDGRKKKKIKKMNTKIKKI